MTHTVPLGRRPELQLAGSAVFSNRCASRLARAACRRAADAARPTTECSRKLDPLSHTEAAYGGRTASLGASLGTRWARGVVATAWNLAAVDSRMSGRQVGNDFVGRLHRVRIHRSGVIRAALIGRSQAGCLVLRGVRACAQRPPPRLPHARRGTPAGLVDKSRRDATLHAQVGLLRRVRSRLSLASLCS